MTNLHGSDPAPGNESSAQRPTVSEQARLVERARLRGGTRALLRQLQLQLDVPADPETRGLVVRAMKDSRDELAAALRGDVRAIDALTAKFDRRLDRSSH
jgi:hypothetical protein